jgi:hypothetical protein
VDIIAHADAAPQVDEVDNFARLRVVSSTADPDVAQLGHREGEYV